MPMELAFSRGNTSGHANIRLAHVTWPRLDYGREFRRAGSDRCGGWTAHWAQAALIIVLLLTGCGIHGGHALIPFGKAVHIHEVAARPGARDPDRDLPAFGRPAPFSARGVFVRELVTVGDVGRSLHHEHDEAIDGDGPYHRPVEQDAGDHPDVDHLQGARRLVT